MKTTPRFLTLLPSAPATWLEVEAFHLRERRLRAGLAVFILELAALICALLCHASTDHLTRAVLFGVFLACAAAAGLYLYAAHEAHRALRKNRKEAGRDA